MSLTADPTDPRLKKTETGGMQEAYLILSADERVKGFVRPVRRSYKHVGVRPKNPLRDLTPEEHERYDQDGYVKYESYGPGDTVVGRFWTAEQLASGCGAVTRMAQELAETYARDPKFYGATFCVQCQKHLPVSEFTWIDDGQVVGS